MVHFEKEIVVEIKDKKISWAVLEFDINNVPRYLEIVDYH